MAAVQGYARIFYFKCLAYCISPYASFCAWLSCIILPTGSDRWNLFAQQLSNHQQFAWKIVRAATEIERKATNTHCLKKIQTCASITIFFAKHFQFFANFQWTKRRLYELFRKKSDVGVFVGTDRRKGKYLWIKYQKKNSILPEKTVMNFHA